VERVAAELCNRRRGHPDGHVYVVTVVVGGNVVKRDGELVGIDREQVLRRLGVSANGLFERSGYPRPILGTWVSDSG
jgi:hypothetical protein